MEFEFKSQIHITSDEKLSYVIFPAQIQNQYGEAQGQVEAFFNEVGKESS